LFWVKNRLKEYVVDKAEDSNIQKNVYNASGGAETYSRQCVHIEKESYATFSDKAGAVSLY